MKFTTHDGYPRIGISGRGWIIPPSETDIEKGYKNLLKGISAITPIDPVWFEEISHHPFDSLNYPSRVAGRIIKNLDEIEIPGVNLKRAKAARFSKLATIAAYHALEDANAWNFIAEAPENCGVLVGTGIGGMEIREEHHYNFFVLKKRAAPTFIPMDIPNMVAYHVGHLAGAKGIGFSPVSACASATHSIGTAYMLIRGGMIDSAICGGTEAPIRTDTETGFAAMKALSTKHNDRATEASRPFDINHDGFVPAEGSGILFIETFEAAHKRGATIYAELCGFGASLDSSDSLVAPLPNGEGMTQSMKQAMAMAGISPSEIGYLNPHGTSTPTGDAPDIKGAIAALGEDVAKKVKVSSTKSMLGHSLGGCGGIEAIVCVEAVRTGWIHPTLNLYDIAPGCEGVDYVRDKAAFVPDLKVAISNSAGFGGQNATLIIKKYEE